MNDIAMTGQLVDFLISITGDGRLTADSDLLSAGIADSLTMMDILVFIETEFQVRLDFADLNPDVFRTPASIASLIALRKGHRAQSLVA